MDDLTRLINDPALHAAAKAAGLLLPRVVPIIVMTPILGGNLLPKRLRIGISLLLVIVLMPALPPAAVAAATKLSGIDYLALLAKELLIGLTLAKLIDLMYQSFVAFGSLVDLSRGATIANVYDPVSQQQESVLGSFFLQVAIVLFLTLGGHMVVIEALGDSVAMLPPHEGLPARLTGQGSVTPILALVAELFIIAIRLAAPAMVVIVLLDVVLGMLNRVAPQIQVYFLGLTLKSGLGLLMIVLALNVINTLFHEHIVHVLREVQRWIGGGG